MSVSVDTLKDLAKPFPESSIRWRVGSTAKKKDKGLALAYLDARDVMTRLDDVLGQDNWQDSFTHDGVRTICQLSVRVGSEWIVKSDGAGNTAIEGEKGGLSDAFKRSAVKWGVGRYLYALPTRWEEIEEQGRGHGFTKEAKARLRGDNPPPEKSIPAEEEPSPSEQERKGKALVEIQKLAMARDIADVDLTRELDEMAERGGWLLQDVPIDKWREWYKNADKWMGAMQTRKATQEAEGPQT